MFEITYQDYLNHLKLTKEKENISEIRDNAGTKEDILKEKANKEQKTKTMQRHDKLFRDLLNNKEEFVKFIESFVDNTINLKVEDIEKYNRSFITKEYKNKHSDIVYKMKDKNVFFLVEHQSTIDYSMPSRLLEYSWEIIRGVIAEDENKVGTKEYIYPKVIPIVLYTGNTYWNVPTYMRQVIYEDFEEIGINIIYQPIDINDYAKEELEEKNDIIAYAMLIERSKTNEELISTLKLIIENSKSKREIENVNRIIDYIVNQRLEDKQIEEMKEMIKRKEVEETMITLAERLAENDKKIMQQGVKQGIKQGVQQGLQKGVKQGLNTAKTAIAKKMIEEKMKPETIARLTGLTEEEIEELTKEKE